MAEHKCFEVIKERWEAPFEKPVSWDKETGEMSADTWMIKLFNWTKSGGISRQGSGYLQISYCPMCGEDLSSGDEVGG